MGQGIRRVGQDNNKKVAAVMTVEEIASESDIERLMDAVTEMAAKVSGSLSRAATRGGDFTAT